MQFFFKNSVQLSQKILHTTYPYICAVVLISTKMMKLCCFKHDNRTVLTLPKIAVTNNGGVSVIRLRSTAIMNTSSQCPLLAITHSLNPIQQEAELVRHGYVLAADSLATNVV